MRLYQFNFQEKETQRPKGKPDLIVEFKAVKGWTAKQVGDLCRRIAEDYLTESVQIGCTVFKPQRRRTKDLWVEVV